MAFSADRAGKQPPARRLEDRIRDLCGRIALSTNGDFARDLAELQRAMNEFALRVHNKTSATVLAWPEFPHDRRKS